MKFYTFGNTSNPVILLLPGTCCHWKQNFEKAISLLETDFFVVCVSYDGFDETEQTVFPDMAAEAEKIEKYIQENFSGRICAAYGCWCISLWIRKSKYSPGDCVYGYSSSVGHSDLGRRNYEHNAVSRRNALA